MDPASHLSGLRAGCTGRGGQGPGLGEGDGGEGGWEVGQVRWKNQVSRGGQLEPRERKSRRGYVLSSKLE